jgi:DNA-binding transcriptional ArsR family regulator
VIDILAALAEPTRFRMVELLRTGPRTVNEMCGRLALNQPRASKHLRVLKAAGLVDVEPRAQERHYALRADRFRELQRWLDRYRQLWDARFDQLDALVEQLHRKEKQGHARRTRTRR